MQVPKGCTLTIKGCGKLEARADKAAVIGAGTSTGSCGNICIKGGDITVSKFTKTDYTVGIGVSSYDQDNITCGDITIEGGDINIKKVCVGIGSYGERADLIVCGKITINGGTVIAEVIPEAYGAGIGSGVNMDYNSSAMCGDITINGGTVIATGAYGAAGIGSGMRQDNRLSTCDNIKITGGTVTATGNAGGAGIGTGWNDSDSQKTSCREITITGGTVTATAIDDNGVQSAAGIGTGLKGYCGNISVTGGIVTATRSTVKRSCDIGRMNGDLSVKVKVDPSVRTCDGKGYTCVVTDRGYNQE